MNFLGFEITRKKKASKEVEVRSLEQLALQLGNAVGLTPNFTALGSDLMRSPTYSQAVRTNAKYCSRAVFSAVRIDKNTGEQVHDYKSLDRLLQLRPNPLQPAAEFWERVATFYYNYNNAFIYIERDANFDIKALWAPEPDGIQYAKLEDGEVWLRFTINGKQVTYPYSLMAHIASNVIKDPLFGVQNDSIRGVLNLINTNYKGVENAIRTSAYIRFIGELVTKVSEEKLAEKSKEFTERYLKVNEQGADNPVGIVFTDSSYKLTPVQTNGQKTANYAEMKQFDEAVYKYLGCPEAIIAGTATEEELVAYLETTPIPFFERVSQELTYKVYTTPELDRGNKITFSDRRLQYMPMETRLKIFQACREMGAFTFGTLGDLLGLPVPAKLRNKVVASQNYRDPNNKGGENDEGDNNKPLEPPKTDQKPDNDDNKGDDEGGKKQ